MPTLKNQMRCSYVKSATRPTSSAIRPRSIRTSTRRSSAAATPIFTAADFQDGDFKMTATVMKMVLNGFAGAGTITLGGYDYHDGTRATGETRNFKAGQ